MSESARRLIRRVTMPRMIPILVAAAVVAAPACSPADDTSDADAAREALAAVDELSAEVDELSETMAAERADTADALDDLERDLRRAIKRLRTSLQSLRAGNDDAASDAAAALARAGEVASELEVLESRYNFHLRRYHGGG